MEQNSSKRDNSKTAHYVGAWLAIGTMFDMMPFENLALGPAINAAVGLLIGAAIDAHERK